MSWFTKENVVTVAAGVGAAGAICQFARGVYRFFAGNPVEAKLDAISSAVNDLNVRLTKFEGKTDGAQDAQAQATPAPAANPAPAQK